MTLGRRHSKLAQQASIMTEQVSLPPGKIYNMTFAKIEGVWELPEQPVKLHWTTNYETYIIKTFSNIFPKNKSTISYLLGSYWIYCSDILEIICTQIQCPGQVRMNLLKTQLKTYLFIFSPGLDGNYTCPGQAAVTIMIIIKITHLIIWFLDFHHLVIQVNQDISYSIQLSDFY